MRRRIRIIRRILRMKGRVGRSLAV